MSRKIFHHLPVCIMLIMIAAASCEKENPLPSLDNGFNAGFGYVGGYSSRNAARNILRNDWSVLTKQLKTAGSRHPDQHFGTDSRAWNGWHYYRCFHDDECDTIGPFNDLEFYECWIYWFYPDGNRIVFW